MGRALISPATIDRLRTNVDEAAMPDVCQFVTYIDAPDGLGGTTRTPSYSGDIPCRFFVPISRLSNREVVDYQVEERGSYRLNVAHDTPVTGDMKVVYQNELYEIVWTPPVTEYSTSRIIGIDKTNQAAP